MDDRELFTVPQGTFDLRRRHHGDDSPLRAWDAADAYALDHLASLDLAGRSIVVVNDAHGALAIALADHHPISISDSFTSWLDTTANRGRTDHAQRSGAQPNRPDQPDRPLPDLLFCPPLGPHPARVDVAIVKVPKTLALLELELAALAPHLSPTSVVIGAGMTRHIHASTVDAFERLIGPTTTSLARRKARLIHSTPAADIEPGPEPRGSETGARHEPPVGWSRFAAPHSGATIVSGPGVFAEGKLDIGTRLLLEHLASRPPRPEATWAIDLGCGNGIVGLSLLLADPSTHVSFIDESVLAVQSARATVAANDDATQALATRSQFFLGDALDADVSYHDESTWHASAIADAQPVGESSADLVVVNPPFHDDHAIGDATAWRMFTGARRVLRPGGEIVVVGNRHLGYHAKLKRIFGNTEVVASNPKFVVLSARR